ncbi:MAG TPA: 50S ribosomal protein L29 [Patescibacteria group bacterium]|nr:50S ribosomal protein L29 [Patescibacteria group bacterium]
MKQKKYEEMKGKKVLDLEKMVEEKKLELFKTQAIIRSGQEKNLKKMKNLRVDIAQLLTLINILKLTKES